MKKLVLCISMSLLYISANAQTYKKLRKNIMSQPITTAIPMIREYIVKDPENISANYDLALCYTALIANSVPKYKANLANKNSWTNAEFAKNIEIVKTIIKNTDSVIYFNSQTSNLLTSDFLKTNKLYDGFDVSIKKVFDEIIKNCHLSSEVECIKSHLNTINQNFIKSITKRDSLINAWAKDTLPKISIVVQNSMTCVGKVWTQINNKWGLDDVVGKEIVPHIYDGIACFYNTGVLLKKFGENTFIAKYGVVDSTGKFIIPLVYSYSGFSGERVFKDSLNKYGVFSSSGEIIIDFKYDDLIQVGNSYIVYDKNINKYGILSLSGAIVIPFEYDKITYERKDCKTNSQWDLDAGYLNGKVRIYVVSKNNKFGVLDSNMNLKIPLIYDFAYLLDKRALKGYIRLKKDNKETYYN